jgi:hypothetical protein
LMPPAAQSLEEEQSSQENSSGMPNQHSSITIIA